MKQIFDKEDFKNLIEGQGVSVVTDVQIVDGEITFTQVINIEGLRKMYERAGLIVRDIEIVGEEVIVKTDAPSKLLKPKD